MTLRLANPRQCVVSATISDNGGVFWLTYSTTNVQFYAETFKSAKAAKISFSRTVLEPRYHGKNIWKAV